MVLVAEKRSPSALHKVLLSPPRQPSLFQLRVCSSVVWGPRRLNGSCRLGRNWKPPVCFREEIRAPKRYERLGGTNRGPGRGLYGDLEVGLGWKGQPREDDWRLAAAA